jgi:adenosylmethionine-8-amino-7-oxononanoate aminotransferase
LAVAVALEVLNVYESEYILEKANALGGAMLAAMQDIAIQTGALTNVRQLGAMVAADLRVKDSNARVGYEVYKTAMKHGALLRSLGNTIYWLPPLNMTMDVLSELKQITQLSVQAIF